MAAVEELSAPPERGKKNPLAPDRLRQSHIQSGGPLEISSIGLMYLISLGYEISENFETGLQMLMFAKILV